MLFYVAVLFLFLNQLKDVYYCYVWCIKGTQPVNLPILSPLSLSLLPRGVKVSGTQVILTPHSGQRPHP